MAKFEEILSDISNKVTGDDADSVKTSLKQLNVLHNDVVDKLQAFGEENKDKRGVIQNLTKQIRNVEDERDNLKQDYDDFKGENSNVMDELDALRQYKADTSAKFKQSYVEKLKSVQNHAKFEKLNDVLHMPQANENGEMDWNALENNQLESNYNEIIKLEKLDYFDKSAPAKKVDGSLGNKGVGNFEQMVENAQTLQELQDIQNRMNN